MGARDLPPDAFDLHRESRGDGAPPVVLLHGLGAHAHSWRKWLPHLARRHRTHTLDLAGFGRAPIPRGADLAPPAQARRVAALVRALGGPPPVLVGHSLGAGTAILAALELQDGSPPLTPAGLILVSGAVYAQKLPPILTLARIPVLGDLFVLAAPPRSVLARGIRGIVRDPETVDGEMVDGYRTPLLSRRRRRAILRAARQLDPRAADLVVDRLAELDVPTLLIWGADDRIVSPELGVRLARELPRAELVTLADVGHLPPEEAPLRSVEPVLSFLDALGRPGAENARVSG